eukprot:9583284-Karenia_brevis.AAC.1
MSTVALYCVVLVALKMASVPVVASVVAAYCLARFVPMLVPKSHGPCCRVTTILWCASSTSCLVSPVYGALVAAVLCCVPQKFLWWPETEDGDDDGESSDVQICRA